MVHIRISTYIDSWLSIVDYHDLDIRASKCSNRDGNAYHYHREMREDDIIICHVTCLIVVMWIDMK